MEAIRSWNKVVKSLLATRDAWNELVEIMETYPEIPPECPTFLSSSSIRSSFEVALPRFVDTWRRSGGLEEMLIPVPSPPRKKKEEKDEGALFKKTG